MGLTSRSGLEYHFGQFRRMSKQCSKSKALFPFSCLYIFLA
ncbi:unnamed protein product, partial [Linum tenue]